MSAYNCVKIDFVDGQSQFRFYENPITIKDYMCGEKSKNESDRIDKKILNHQNTPYDSFGDVVEEITVLTENEKLIRHQRSITVSVNRTKNMVYNYARANVWKWFITLTFDSKKIDRYNYNECSKKLRQWLNNMRKKYAPDLKYLIIPEQHKDGAYHFHGLLSNTGNIKFNKATNHYSALPLLTKSGLQIFNFGSYKLGFSSATAIADTAKVSSYVTKYITKELAFNTAGYRRYYPSANLNLPQKTYFFVENEEKLEFLKEHKDRVTFNKQVKIKHGYYENLIDYIEMKVGDIDV